MGTLYIVATPIGNLGDITKRALDVLQSVDIILCEDTRTSSHLLNFYSIKTKLISYHKFNEEKRTEELILELKNGKNMALITDAGTPCISDPGSILIKACIKDGIEIFSLPGPSGIITALTLSGLTLNNFAFYGFLERKANLRLSKLKEIDKNDIEIVVFYEAPKRILDTLKSIEEAMENPYVVVLNDLTKKFEKKYYGLASKVISDLENNSNHELGEYVIVVLKNKRSQVETKEELSLEAILLDKVIKEKCTMKEAISKVANIYKNKYSKNQIYNASLNIKKLLK